MKINALCIKIELEKLMIRACQNKGKKTVIFGKKRAHAHPSAHYARIRHPSGMITVYMRRWDCIIV